MSDERTTTPSSDAGLVPAELPAMRTDTPPPARAVKGLGALPGMVLLWLLPKRLGAPLSAAGWRVAIIAHLIGMSIGLSLIALALLTALSVSYGIPGFPTFTIDIPQGGMTLAESLRAPFVSLVTIVHIASSDVGRLDVVILVVLGVPVIWLLLAAMKMPFAAAGERLRSLYGRCLRLTLWSTTMLIPLGAGCLLWPCIMDLCGVKAASQEGMFLGASVPTPDRRADLGWAALALFVLWWLVVLLRSGLRYAGPPDGPAWKGQRPRCTRCGYIISQLPLAGNCPECGRPVRDSLAVLTKDCRFSRGRAFRASVRAALTSLRR